MEHLLVNRNNLSVISFFLFFSVYSLNMNSQNKDADFFSLYKGGELFKKKLVYINYDNAFKSKIYSNHILYTKENISFVYEFKIHKKEIIKADNVNKYEISLISDLHSFERKIIENAINQIEKEHGFKPVYPLKHIALKVFLVKNKGCKTVELIEVEWSSKYF